jgi:hypothetical protein
MTKRIIIYGSDPVLLMTRQAILSKAGLVSTITSDIADVIDFLKTEAPVLLVVCSSVQHDLRGALMTAVDQVAKPDLRKLILAKQLAQDDPPANAKEMQTPASPKKFIETVQEFIQ